MAWNTLKVPLETGWQCTLVPGPQYYDLTGWGRGYRNSSARQLYQNIGQDNFSWSPDTWPSSDANQGASWEKARIKQLADDKAAFARHFRPNWDLRTISGARALRDVKVFVRDQLNVAHWNQPTDNAALKKLLCDAVATGRLVPVVNREFRGVPRVAQADPAPQHWPAMGGSGSAYPPRVLSAREFDALKRINGELPALDAIPAGIGVTLDSLSDLGTTARADDGFGFVHLVETAAATLPGSAHDEDPFSTDLSNDATPLGDAQPFAYRQDDAQYGDSFDIAKTPNDGEPGTWYTNPGSGQMRLYGDDRKAVVDFDFDHDHGQGVPHAHNWSNGVRGPGVAFSPL
ncbi:MAG TPA: hypothetical protein VG320_16655 [Paraburkholderia sp.]|jgi:hypothetical protein|uniref:hypothetical protein n=1 Tax=Paraburkholderia sp. TaxID=1926495 RepID=UPI002DE6919A|nr:hypothetical protein [Paraburkholderia sp.]